MSRMAELDAAISKYREARKSLSSFTKMAEESDGDSVRAQITNDAVIDTMLMLCISAADDLVEILYPEDSQC